MHWNYLTPSAIKIHSKTLHTKKNDQVKIVIEACSSLKSARDQWRLKHITIYRLKCFAEFRQFKNVRVKVVIEACSSLKGGRVQWSMEFIERWQVHRRVIVTIRKTGFLFTFQRWKHSHSKIYTFYSNIAEKHDLLFTHCLLYFTNA